MKFGDRQLDSRRSLWVAQNQKTILFFFTCLLAAGFLVLLGDAAQADQCNRVPPSPSQGTIQVALPIPIVLTPVTSKTFEGNLSVRGTLEAAKSTLVSSRRPGTIEEIYVDEGDSVDVHKTKLFRMDTLQLEKAVDLRRRDFELASSELQVEIEILKLLEKDQKKAFIDLQQFQELIAKGLISSEEFKRAETRYLRSRSAFRLSNRLTALASKRKQHTKTALELAAEDFSNAIVYAPISGRVTRRFRGPGERCDSGQPVLSIEDPSIIDVAARLPTRYYALIHPGKTRLNLETCGIKLWDQVISFKSFSIDPGKCTFTVKSRLKELTEEILSGASAEVTIPLPPCEGPGVPSSCIQRRGKEAFVFVLKGKTAHRVLVQTGIECDGWTHLTAGNLHQNDLVVSEGCLRLQEGTPVVTKKKGP